MNKLPVSKVHYLALLAGLPLAAVVAWRLGGSVGVGAAVGAGSGLLLALAGAAAQHWAQLRRPKLVMAMFMAAFLAKLAVLALGAGLLGFDDELAARCAPSAFLLGFAAAVLWSLVIGAALGLRLAFPSKELRTP
jgi:hypothetical protein